MCNAKHYFRFPNSICSGSTAYNGTCYSRWALHEKMLTLAKIDLDNLWNNWRFCTSISSFKIKLEEICNTYIDSWINLIFYCFFNTALNAKPEEGITRDLVQMDLGFVVSVSLFSSFCSTVNDVTVKV